MALRVALSKAKQRELACDVIHRPIVDLHPHTLAVNMPNEKIKSAMQSGMGKTDTEQVNVAGGRPAGPLLSFSDHLGATIGKPRYF